MYIPLIIIHHAAIIILLRIDIMFYFDTLYLYYKYLGLRLNKLFSPTLSDRICYFEI